MAELWFTLVPNNGASNLATPIIPKQGPFLPNSGQGLGKAAIPLFSPKHLRGDLASHGGEGSQGASTCLGPPAAIR